MMVVVFDYSKRALKASGPGDCLRWNPERGDLLPAVTNRLREGIALPEFVDQPGFLEIEMKFVIESSHRLSVEVGFFAPPVNVVFQIGKIAGGREKGVEVASGVRPVVRGLPELGLEVPSELGALNQ